MSNPLVRILAVVDDSVAMLERIALAAGVLGMTLVNVANVIMRNFFDASLAFANEINMALITALLLFVLAFHATRYAWNTWQIGTVTPALRIPLGLIYATAPVGLALGGVQYVLTAMRNIAEHDVYESFTQKDEYDDSPDTGPARI